ERLIVVYHAACIDGAASAWAVSRSSLPASSVETKYIAYAHTGQKESEDKITDFITREESSVRVYFVDVVPSPAFLEKLLTIENINHVTLLDHHKTAAETFVGYPLSDRLTVHIHPDLSSAAKMVWQYLMPR